tara:strand:+ start:1426 stop:1758 length:333 start_codon:yes stop_codon:yes gene_type:complete
LPAHEPGEFAHDGQAQPEPRLVAGTGTDVGVEDLCVQTFRQPTPVIAHPDAGPVPGGDRVDLNALATTVVGGIDDQVLQYSQQQAGIRGQGQPGLGRGNVQADVATGQGV